jgi:alginate O-acetyltransferase complex protein AlgI
VKKLDLLWGVASVLERFGGAEHAVRYLGEISTGRAWFICGLIYLQVYLDFSAYTDLAIGTSRLFGFRIMENFRWPIFATSIGGFWTRWHRTLAGWCQAYIYMPLLGLTRNPYLAVYAAFTAIGIWHAGSLAFLLWGIYHSTGVAVYHLWRRRGGRLARRFPGRVGGWILTQLFVIGSFAITLPGAGQDGREGLRVLAKLLFLDVG